MWWTAAAILIGVGCVAYVRSTSLSRRFEIRKAHAAFEPLPEMPVLTGAVIDHLPRPVQRYIRLTGSMGRPPVTEIEMHFDAEMFEAGSQAGMLGPVKQYDRFDIPHRLFLMNTRMKGLPVAVLHDFERNHASMRVRLSGLFDVVNTDGKELTRTETVTILNDTAFFAPSRLADACLNWTELDDTQAKVDYTLGPNTISAELVFNEIGELVDFISEDRGMLEEDGRLRITRWSTPMGKYRNFDGWTLASEGSAIWHLPDGPFTYGHLQLTGYTAR